MPKIDTEVREGADDITEGVAYEIVNVEEITTDVQSLAGIRVTLLSVKAEEGNVMLWKRKVTGSGSKLGVFITELGHNTDGLGIDLRSGCLFGPDSGSRGAASLSARKG